jgi:hypothetical protein
MASHPGVFYYLDVSPTDGSRVRDREREEHRRATAGTRLIWGQRDGQSTPTVSRIVTRDAILAAGCGARSGASVRDRRRPAQPRTAPGWDARFRLAPAQWLAFKSPTRSDQ